MQELLNRSRHRTDLFDLAEQLVVRRASGLSLQLGGGFVGKAVKKCIFTLDGSSLAFEAAAAAAADPDSWSLKSEQDGRLEIKISARAPIGRYGAELEFDGGTKKALPKKLVILFNPWAEADDVYLADEVQRQEYVVEDDGAIWVGSSDRYRPRPWNFGQYDEGVLAACLSLLKSFDGDRGDVVMLSRHLSAVVNHIDEGGVLVGNWSGDYADGKSPTSWVGSAPILLQWLQSGPVKFGQCWVFSGVLTTVCRCLGIPARSVTCFDSAHDTNFNRVIDKFYDESHERLQISGDSIWNFHVWNDVWFRRRDLPVGRDGWQAIDATPQELSAGKWQCGPAAHVDIKAGRGQQDETSYDLDFLIGEVNADVRYYIVKDGERKLVRVDPDHVGKYLITKAVGSYSAHDVTSEYKHEEGTVAERVALLAKAMDSTYKLAEKGTFAISHAVGLMVGEDIAFQLKASGTSEKWACRMAVRATSYRGRALEVLGETTQVLEPGQQMSLAVKTTDYLKFLKDTDFPISVIVHCVNETGDAMWLDELVTAMQVGELQVAAPAELKIADKGNWGDVSISWKNPLPVPLTGSKLEVAASGILLFCKQVGDMAPGTELKETVPLSVPEGDKHWANGHVQVVATLVCVELQDVIGRADIKIA